MFLAPFKFSEFRYFVGAIIREIFKVALVTYLFFYLLETMRPGVISNYFDLDILFLTAIISGVLSICPWPVAAPEKPARLAHFYDYVLVMVLAGIAGSIVYFQFKSTGGMVGVLALLTSIAVAGATIFLLKNNNKKNGV